MISFLDLTKHFSSGHEIICAMDNLTLDVEDRSFFTLLGPSGCGKSTLLRSIAGLEVPTSGRISIGGHVVFCSKDNVNVPPNRRNIGMVFQSYAIWPHMTVFSNVSYPLEVRGVKDVRARVMRALEMVELDTLAERYASKLSGGQQQRVAFARAIVSEPDVLLLDEPLSNLDAALRETMRSELRQLQRRLSITTVYVTHDQSEALSMSDRIAVMRAGRFIEIAAPEDLYNRPRTAFTAQFIGGANVISGVASGKHIDGNVEVSTSFGRVWVKGSAAAGPVTLFVRPEKVVPLTKSAAMGIAPNVLECLVQGDLFTGEGREFDLIPTGSARTLIRSRAHGIFAATIGDSIHISIHPSDIMLLKAE